MKLRENSWHCQTYLAAYPRPLPEDFCSYFWKVMAALVLLPFLVPYLVGRRLEELCDDTSPVAFSPWESLGHRILASVLLWAAGVLGPFTVGMGVNNIPDIPLWLQFVPWLTGATILVVGLGILVVCVNFQEYLSERKSRASVKARVETEGFFSAKIRSVRGRYCPRIDWEDNR